MPGTTRELTNTTDFPRATSLPSGAVIPGMTSTGEPIGLPVDLIKGPLDNLAQGGGVQIYATTAAGLAAPTAVGEYFYVEGSGDEILSLYRVDSGPVATKVDGIPSFTFAMQNMIFSSSSKSASELVAMSRVRAVRLYGADPTKYYFLKYLFWKDVGSRFNMTITQADDLNGTNSVDVASYAISSGADTWNTLRLISLSQVASSGISGAVIIDFSDTSAMVVRTPLSSAGVFQRRVLGPRAVAMDDDHIRNIVDEQIAGSVAEVYDEMLVNPRARFPFTNTMDNAVLRDLVKDIKVYGAKDGHRYAISRFSITDFTTHRRLLVDLYDLDENAVVARLTWNNYTAADTAAFIAEMAANTPVIGLHDYLITTKTLIFARMEIDWSKASGAFSQVGTTDAFGGIHPDAIYTDEMISDYLDCDRWDEVIRVGAGEDFTTLRAAVESTYSYIFGATIIYGSPMCERACYHHRILIDLIDDGEYLATGLYIPSWVEVRGNGIDRTVIRRENTDPDPVLEVRTTTKFRDCTILTETPNEYSLHSDDFNRNVLSDKSVDDGSPDDGQNYRIGQSFKRMKLTAAPGHNGWIFGCGVSAGQEIRFEDVIGEHLDSTATAPAFGFHNTGPTLSSPALKGSYNPAQVVMRGVSCPNDVAVQIQTLEASPVFTLDIQDCDFNKVAITVASGYEVLVDKAKDRIAWRIGGKFDGAWTINDPVGANVLKTSEGASISGSASTLLFGTSDEHGRGEKWIADPNDYSLGARIGNCSTYNQTLTIGGQTHTFNADERAKTNATILAEINASLTSNPISIVSGENVLKTTAGKPITGTMANNLFGTVDATGRGSVLVGFSVGERLGDCSTTSKTLTIGGQTHTFDADERAKTNATILAEINASLTSNPISIVNISYEFLPDAAPKRRVNNNTGATIPAGRFIKFTGNGTVALCGADERPEGWTYRAILDGDDGYVLKTKRVWDELISGANTATGEWGITTAGQIDYSASVKLGRTVGDIVEIY